MNNDEKKDDNTAVDNYAAPEIAVATNVEVTEEGLKLNIVLSEEFS